MSKVSLGHYEQGVVTFVSIISENSVEVLLPITRVPISVPVPVPIPIPWDWYLCTLGSVYYFLNIPTSISTHTHLLVPVPVAVLMT